MTPFLDDVPATGEAIGRAPGQTLAFLDRGAAQFGLLVPSSFATSTDGTRTTRRPRRRRGPIARRIASGALLERRFG